MSDDITEVVKKTISERLSSPWVGYIALSWLGFNWDNIAYLFMSSAKVEQKIATIQSEPYHLFYSYILPIFTGLLLALISPYIQLGFTVLHRLAAKKSLDFKHGDDAKQIERKVILARLEKNLITEAEAKAELKAARLKTVIARQEKRTAAIETDTSELILAYQNQEKRVQEKRDMIKFYEDQVFSSKLEVDQLATKLSRVAELYVKSDFTDRSQFLKFIKMIHEYGYFNDDFEGNFIKMLNKERQIDFKNKKSIGVSLDNEAKS